MSADDYLWHYDYARLACDSGFTFQNHRPKPSLNKNLGAIDIEQVIRERDIASIEKYIGTVLEFSLDNDQTSILDPCFVKVFRLSQLSVEYLLFCKKYLDNTVALIKKEFIKVNEEAKEDKQYIEELRHELASSKKQVKELKSALSCQIASTQNIPVHQCSDCPKAFSSEEYLLAHIKRRHDAFKNAASGTSFQAETDKLQLEIKELKERLNNTEKLIHNEDASKPVREVVSAISIMSKNNVENSLLADLQQKFELLKVHVENELRLLQTQKFDQEKYERWFETFLNKLEQSHIKQAASNEGITEVKQNNEMLNNEEISQRRNVIDSATQTDANLLPNYIVCRNCQARESPSFRTTHEKPSAYEHRNSLSDGENINQMLQLEKIEEMLKEKVTGSIEKLENQMQTFWNKMNEAEKQKMVASAPASNKDLPDTKENFLNKNAVIQPQIVMPKPRKKLSAADEAFKSISSHEFVKPVVQMSDSKTNKKNKFGRVKIIRVPTTNVITLKKANVNFNSGNDSISDMSEDSESSDDESADNEIVAVTKPSKVSTLGQRSLTSLKEAAFTPEVLQGLKKEFENVVNNKLEELGVNPEWTALPEDSFRRTLNIVTHQASLIQKNIENYKQIRGQILRDVHRQVLEMYNTTPQRQSKLKNILGNVHSKVKGIIQNESKQSKKDEVKGVKRKPRDAQAAKAVHDNKSESTNARPEKMYTTDSESDSMARSRKVWGTSKLADKACMKAYGNVMKELSTTVTTKMKHHESTISDASEISVSDKHVKNGSDENNKVEIQAKGVLKNYPSVGSLHKKKVLFDLDYSATEPKHFNNGAQNVKVAEGGSTTSIASSVLDGSKTNLAQKNEANKPNELSDVSDWDISEVLN